MKLLQTTSILLLLPSAVFAQDNTVASSTFWDALVDNALGISILVVFVSAILGALIKARKRDRVLKDFDSYDVTLLLADGQRIWGRAEVFPNGLVLNFRESWKRKNSFIVYASEYTGVRAVLRRDQDLTEPLRRRRAADLKAFHNPSPARRVTRDAASVDAAADNQDVGVRRHVVAPSRPASACAGR